MINTTIAVLKGAFFVVCVLRCLILLVPLPFAHPAILFAQAEESRRVTPSGRLAFGMYAEVVWAAGRPQPSLFVPRLAVATTTERTFVIRIRDGVTEWVDVKRGSSMDDLIEVFGSLAAGDTVAAQGTDELRTGTRVVGRPAAPHADV